MKLLSDVFTGALYRIPDYQRGYSWKEKQRLDLLLDLLNLQEDKFHYTGNIVLTEIPKEKWSTWGNDAWYINRNQITPYYIVDGQQRITTIVIILNALVKAMEKNEKYLGMTQHDIIQKYLYTDNANNTLCSFLFGYEIDDPSDAYFKKDILGKSTNLTKQPETAYTNNLGEANKFFIKEILNLPFKAREVLFKKITKQLIFDVQLLNEKLDIFVVFETLNNRGKKLSNLEMLKNRLIYLVTLLPKIKSSEIEQTRNSINTTWKDIYEFLGRNKKNQLVDDDFLRTHFIMYHYFNKEKDYPYKNIFDDLYRVTNVISSNPTLGLKDIMDYITNMREAIEQWYIIKNSKAAFEEELISADEAKWLLRVNRLIVGNFNPLILAVFMKEKNAKKRVEFLIQVESFCFLNYYCAGRRSSFGNTEYPTMAGDYFADKITLDAVCHKIYQDTHGEIDGFTVERFIANIKDYMKGSKKSGYYDWPGLRYLLHEYDDSLVKSKHDESKVRWEKQNTIEHIYPQNDTNLYWKKNFKGFHHYKKYLSHSLGNLVLQSKEKNSSLSNSSFPEKCAEGYRYGSHSEIELANKFKQWRPRDIYLRGKDIMNFLQKRWNVKLTPKQLKEILLVDKKLITKIR
jgi:uncharacterized protein with ParB-like and HNH nuclease domain